MKKNNKKRKSKPKQILVKETSPGIFVYYRIEELTQKFRDLIKDYTLVEILASMERVKTERLFAIKEKTVFPQININEKSIMNMLNEFEKTQIKVNKHRKSIGLKNTR